MNGAAGTVVPDLAGHPGRAGADYRGAGGRGRARVGPGDPLTMLAWRLGGEPAEDHGPRSRLAVEVPACLQDIGLGIDQAPLRARHPA